MGQYERRKPLPERYEVGFLKGLDRRTDLYRRVSESYESILEDLGGEKSISRVRLALVERFVFLEAVLRESEREIAANPKLHDDKLNRWIQALNSLSGIAKTIGLERKAKSVSLKAYVGGKQA